MKSGKPAKVGGFGGLKGQFPKPLQGARKVGKKAKGSGPNNGQFPGPLHKYK